MDMLRLFRHKITCLFHPDSNRWYWDLTSSAGMRTNAHTGRGLIGSAAGVLTCTTAPLWHRPIYRQWGISPRPETATASVAPVGYSRKYAMRLIYGGDQLPQQPRSPSIAKVTRLSRQSRETATGTRIPISHDLRPRRPQGRKRRESGGGTGTSLRNIPQDAKRLRSAKRDAEPLCMSEDVPERSPRPAPGFPVGVLDLVGLSTYRRPADQRWQQR